MKEKTKPDVEIMAMKKIGTALESLDGKQAYRVLRYCMERNNEKLYPMIKIDLDNNPGSIRPAKEFMNDGAFDYADASFNART